MINLLEGRKTGRQIVPARIGTHEHTQVHAQTAGSQRQWTIWVMILINIISKPLWLRLLLYYLVKKRKERKGKLKCNHLRGFVHHLLKFHLIVGFETLITFFLFHFSNLYTGLFLLKKHVLFSFSQWHTLTLKELPSTTTAVILFAVEGSCGQSTLPKGGKVLLIRLNCPNWAFLGNKFAYLLITHQPL